MVSVIGTNSIEQMCDLIRHIVAVCVTDEQDTGLVDHQHTVFVEFKSRWTNQLCRKTFDKYLLCHRRRYLQRSTGRSSGFDLFGNHWG